MYLAFCYLKAQGCLVLLTLDDFTLQLPITLTWGSRTRNPTMRHHRTWNMDMNFLKPLKAMNWGYLLTSNYHYLDLWRQKIEGVSSIRLVCISSLVCQPAEFVFIYFWELAFILLVSSSAVSTWSSIIVMLPLSLFRSLQMICFRASRGSTRVASITL